MEIFEETNLSKKIELIFRANSLTRPEDLIEVSIIESYAIIMTKKRLHKFIKSITNEIDLNLCFLVTSKFL